MTYHETITSLFNLLIQANLADSELKEKWQKGFDASSTSYYGHIEKAIVSIAGNAILDFYNESNELDLSLASRN